MTNNTVNNLQSTHSSRLNLGTILANNLNNIGNIRDSQIERASNRSKGSSKFSNIDKLNRGNYNIVEVNRNETEGYRLSNLSKLDDNKKSSYQDSNNIVYQNGFRNNNASYRQSDQQNNQNYSQMSFQSNIKNETPVWMSLKPQQPYIPSSHNYNLDQANYNIDPNYNMEQMVCNYNGSDSNSNSNYNNSISNHGMVYQRLPQGQRQVYMPANLNQ